MKIGLWVVLIVLGLAGVQGCGEQAQEQQGEARDKNPQNRGVSSEEIVIGSHTDLSGQTAIWGVGSINAARMVFDGVNESGGIYGRKIRFVVEDTQYQIPRAIQAANKLINRDDVFAMLLAVGTPTNNAVMTQQFEAGVPNLFPISGARSMVEPFHRLKFTQRGIYYDEVRAATKYFVEEEGKEQVCVVYQDTDYGQEILEGVQDQTAAMNLSVAAVSSHKPTESEFTASALRLKNAKCDLVLLGTVHRDTILVLDTARKMGLNNIAWVGNNAAYAQVIADQDSGDGYYSFVHMSKIYPDDEKSPAVQAWWDAYVERYNAEPGLAAMEGYRAAHLTVTALEAAGQALTTDAFVAALEGITDYEDIFGYKVSFAADKHSGATESVLSQVQQGRWVELEQSISY